MGVNAEAMIFDAGKPIEGRSLPEHTRLSTIGVEISFKVFECRNRNSAISHCRFHRFLSCARQTMS